jgi:hypothetical protein
MVEFFQNSFNWIVSNKDNIILFFTSTNFVTFISTIILLIKQIKTTKSNMSTVNTLSDSLKSTNSLATDVTNVSTSSELAVSNTEKLKAQVEDMDAKFMDMLDSINRKLDAILDVQAIVYSSIKDESSRKNVANILTTAKLLDTSSKAELQRQLEELKAFKAAMLNTVTETGGTKVGTVEQKPKTATTKKNTSLRY